MMKSSNKPNTKENGKQTNAMAKGECDGQMVLNSKETGTVINVSEADRH